jgi:hypothetical protein
MFGTELTVRPQGDLFGVPSLLQSMTLKLVSRAQPIFMNFLFGFYPALPQNHLVDMATTPMLMKQRCQAKSSQRI